MQRVDVVISGQVGRRVLNGKLGNGPSCYGLPSETLTGPAQTLYHKLLGISAAPQVLGHTTHSTHDGLRGCDTGGSMLCHGCHPIDSDWQQDHFISIVRPGLIHTLVFCPVTHGYDWNFLAPTAVTITPHLIKASIKDSESSNDL